MKLTGAKHKTPWYGFCKWAQQTYYLMPFTICSFLWHLLQSFLAN